MHRATIAAAACALAFAASTAAARSHGRDEDWDSDSVRLTSRAQEDIRKTLHFGNPSGPKELLVDNVNGSIRVVGYDGRDVELVAHETIQARSDAKIAEAKQKVRLDIQEEADEIKLYVDGPFRDGEGGIHDRGPRWTGYKVSFDFELRVPHATNLTLKTVNEGEIQVEDVSGSYDVDNINGGIEMTRLGGPGRVYALNGKVKVQFDKNPNGKSYFGSLNGDVEVSFRRNLSADVRLKTFNGGVFSDFPVTYLAGDPPTQERKGGRFVYKKDQSAKVRIGQGGPEIMFDAFNGNIRIMNRDE